MEGRMTYRLARAWADALWRRWRRTGSLRLHGYDPHDSAPRALSPVEIKRMEEILKRHREMP